MTGRRGRALYLLIALALPALVVGYANATYAYNHFYASGPGPFMLDAGWFSGVALLFARSARPRRIVSILLIGLSALIFTFNGQALACMGFPHYEILIVAGVCIMLAGLASGRANFAWLGIALATFTREDGGGQACQFLAAVLVSDFLGRPFRVERRGVFVMLAVATAATVLMMGLQRVFFPGGSLFRHEYLGEPAYAHITGSIFWTRLAALRSCSQFVIWPFGLAIVVAAVDRDPRWLLGYVVTIPWFFLNLLAVMPLKTTFNIYTGFPFICSIFWFGAYGIVKHGATVRALWRMVAVSVASSVGVMAANLSWTHFELEMMAAPWSQNASGIRAYARGLRAGAFGPVLTDPPVASLALETLPLKAQFDPRLGKAQVERFESFSFFHNDFVGALVFDPVVRGGFTSCGRLARTELVFCTQPSRPLPTGFEPWPLFVASLRPIGHSDTSSHDETQMFVEPGDPAQLGVVGPRMPLPAQRYRTSIDLQPAAGEACDHPVHLEVFVVARSESLGNAYVVPGAGSVTIDFAITRDLVNDEYAEVRFYSTSCRYEIRALSISGTR